MSLRRDRDRLSARRAEAYAKSFVRDREEWRGHVLAGRTWAARDVALKMQSDRREFRSVPDLTPSVQLPTEDDMAYLMNDDYETGEPSPAFKSAVLQLHRDEELASGGPQRVIVARRKPKRKARRGGSFVRAALKSTGGRPATSTDFAAIYRDIAASLYPAPKEVRERKPRPDATRATLHKGVAMGIPGAAEVADRYDQAVFERQVARGRGADERSLLLATLDL